MPPERTLTDADIDAISRALAERHCACLFADSEVAAIREMLKVLHETKSTVIKVVVTTVLSGIFVVIALGFRVWSKQ